MLQPEIQQPIFSPVTRSVPADAGAVTSGPSAFVAGVVVSEGATRTAQGEMAYRAEVGIDRGEDRHEKGDLIVDPADWLIEQGLVVEVEDEAPAEDDASDDAPTSDDAPSAPDQDEAKA